MPGSVAHSSSRFAEQYFPDRLAKFTTPLGKTVSAVRPCRQYIRFNSYVVLLGGESILKQTAQTVNAEFDGTVFVPCVPVELPVGTRVEIILPKTAAQLTAEEMREWQQIEREIAASPPQFPTTEEAMNYTRKRP